MRPFKALMPSHNLTWTSFDHVILMFSPASMPSLACFLGLQEIVEGDRSFQLSFSSARVGKTRGEDGKEILEEALSGFLKGFQGPEAL